MPRPVRSGRRTPWLTALAIVACALLAAPIAYLVLRVAQGDAATLLELILRQRTLHLTLSSLALALAVGATTLAIGTLQAIALSRVQLPVRIALTVVAILPLAMPSYIAAFGWQVLTPSTTGPVAAWLILSAVSLPYVMLPTLAALTTAPTTLEVAARTLGRGPAAAFFAGTWPRIRPAALAGALLASLYGLSDFGVVALLRVETLATGIARAQFATFERAYAPALALLLVTLALLLVWFESRMRGATSVAQLHRRRPVRAGVGAWRIPIALAVVLPSLLIVAAPLASLTVRMVQVDALASLDAAGLARAAATTLNVAFAGGCIAFVLALPVALLVARTGTRLARFLEGIAVATHGLPGVVVGLSMVMLTLALFPGIYQTTIALIVAYAVMATSRAVGSLRSGLERVPQRLTHVARSLGANPASAFARVTVPNAAPGALAAVLVSTLVLMKELPATLMLSPIGFSTLATELWARTDVARHGAAAPYALALAAVSAIPVLVVVVAYVRTERKHRS